MWSTLDCFLCCKKFAEKSSIKKVEPTPKHSLLPKNDSKKSTGKKNDSQPSQTQYYTVRRVSRIAGTISLEDLNDDSDASTNKKGKNPKIVLGKNNKEINDSGLWECPSESSFIDEKSSCEILKTPSPPIKKQPMKSWQKQLQAKTVNQFRSHLNVTPNKSLAVSTPDLSKLKSAPGDVTPPRSTSPMARQEELRRAGTLGDVSGSSWLKSQSMLDVASLGSTNSARDFGLDPKLYPAPERNNSSARSRSPSPRSREERFAEMSHGTVHFAAAYSAGKLHIHVHYIEEIPPKGEGRSYPVTLKLEVLPQEKGQQVKTSKTARDSKSAKFNEDFDFSVDSVAGRTLRISAVDAGTRGKFDAIGHVLFDLEEVQHQTQPKTKKMKLHKQSEPSSGHSGLLQASLSYEQREQKIVVLALQCRGLQLAQARKTPDKYTTYVKASLYCKGQKVKSKKSNVIINEKDPYYNHEFELPISPDLLSESVLVLSVLLKSRLRTDALIGRIIFGPNFVADGNEMTPWGRVVQGQQTASHWYRLYI